MCAAPGPDPDPEPSAPVPDALWGHGDPGGHVLPIILIAFAYGSEVGFLAGFAYGILNLLLNPYILHPVQVLFICLVLYRVLPMERFKGLIK